MHRIIFLVFFLLGVTTPHPIFSTTHNDWRLAGELVVGEKVLTYHGEATVLSNEKKAGIEPVYNLEVKDLHNYLVGENGVVVHNTCPIKLLKEAITTDGIRIKKLNGKLEIPENWEMHDLLKADGTKKGVRYVHPQNPNIQVRVMVEGLVPGKHNHGKPYIKYELGKDANGNMQHADINGNLIARNLSASEYFLRSHILVDNIKIIP